MPGSLSATVKLQLSCRFFCQRRKCYARRYISTLRAEEEPSYEDSVLSINVILGVDTAFTPGTIVDIEGELLPGTKGATLDVDVYPDAIGVNDGMSFRFPAFSVLGQAIGWTDSSRTMLITKMVTSTGFVYIVILEPHPQLPAIETFEQQSLYISTTGSFLTLLPLPEPYNNVALVRSAASYPTLTGMSFDPPVAVHNTSLSPAIEPPDEEVAGDESSDEGLVSTLLTAADERDETASLGHTIGRGAAMIWTAIKSWRWVA